MTTYPASTAVRAARIGNSERNANTIALIRCRSRSAVGASAAVTVVYRAATIASGIPFTTIACVSPDMRQQRIGVVIHN